MMYEFKTKFNNHEHPIVIKYYYFFHWTIPSEGENLILRGIISFIISKNQFYIKKYFKNG